MINVRLLYKLARLGTYTRNVIVYYYNILLFIAVRQSPLPGGAHNNNNDNVMCNDERILILRTCAQRSTQLLLSNE